MVLFELHLNVMDANVRARKLLRFCRSAYGVVQSTFLCVKQVDKKIQFNKKLLMLRSYPIFEGGNVTGALVTVREDRLKGACYL
ncbi:MAG: hypothetical protein A2Y08_00935 [Planctomycetes bacterium GWA2_40_7]|nr:MAG: hypothetical protein A2Y08_00935 [Planctomycetes bacterium GWA2_40_7]